VQFRRVNGEMMATVSKNREIIEDFAREIQKRKSFGPKPSKEVINFRTDMKDGRERDVYQVPIELLRYRKDNGRIASDVTDYERTVGPIDEQKDDGQAKLAEFLASKDPEKTAILRNSIIHGGQAEPAIITCDGFLINGNRRKMVMDKLRAEYKGDVKYTVMKVVILPGNDDEGGPPTLLEIEQIENRYQLQSDGKSEYYGFDRALSIKRKIDVGLSLEEQLRDDPRFAEASQSQLEKAVRDWHKDYLDPLECVDRYLRQFKREGQYRTISTGMSDPEGRWQAFIDYSLTYTRVFRNPKRLLEFNIEEEDVGSIEEAAFDIIRLRSIPDMPKVHTIMRDLPKYCSTKDGKREIIKITEEVDPILPAKEMKDENGDPFPLEQVDRKWITKNKTPIIHHLKKARNRHEIIKEKETPLELLQAAIDKLAPDVLDMSSVDLKDLPKARKLTKEIEERATEIESEIYHTEKEFKKLGKK
jgi:hypothetical protein